MPLNDTQKVRMLEWLKEKEFSATCPACMAVDQWTPGEIIVGTTVNAYSLPVQDSDVPMVQLVCANCYHILLFAAAPIGLLLDPDADVEREAERDTTTDPL